jgi:hypothetical protein
MPGMPANYDPMEEFRNLLEYQGDGRTKDAIKLKRIKEGLQTNGNQAMTELFCNVIAHNLLIEKKMTNQLLADDNLVDNDGNLNPAVSKDLLKLRANTLQYLKMLQKIKSSGGGNNDDFNIADLLDENN